MKHSNIWFALILIASALLLNGVSDGSGATPSNQPHPNQIEQTANGQQPATTPVATVVNQPSTAPTSSQPTNYTYNYYYPAPESWLTFFGQIAGIVTAILLTAFTGGLWWTSIQQWRAISGQIRAQMDAERPWVMLQKRELKDWTLNGDFAPRATFHMFKYGKGICFMERTKFRLAIYPGSPYGPQLPAQPDYSDLACSFQKLIGIPIRPDKFHPTFALFQGQLDQATFDRVRRFQSTLVFYGLIEYRDAFKRKHKHGFCSVYLPAGAYGDEPIWNDVGGPDSYRYETTEENAEQK
jgi:hypothetical protein